MSQSFRLGVFVVITLVLFATAVFMIGDKQTRFTSTYRISTQFPNVTGLNEGADVRVGGIRKGTVRRINLPKEPKGQVTVIMDLEKETQDVVKQDSVARIKTEGLLGDKYMEVSFGSPDAARVRANEVIASQPTVDITSILDKTDVMLEQANGAMQNVQGAAGNLKDITTKVNQGTGTVGALVNDKALYQQATDGVTALREDAEALKHNFLLRGFFRSRGYENASEVTRNEVKQLPDVPPQKTFTYDATLLFDKGNSTKLKNPKLLKELENYLQAESFSSAIIAASTEAKGDAAENRELSEARAFVVRKYLVERTAADDQRIKTLGLGETAELGNKIEVVFYPPGQPVPANGKPAAGK